MTKTKKEKKGWKKKNFTVQGQVRPKYKSLWRSPFLSIFLSNISL